jgi:hybrid cluster-associated redox disulfide protein
MAKAAKGTEAPKAQIRKDMRVADILGLVPDAGPLLQRYGLHCFGCVYSGMESLKDGCMSHGFADDDVDQLVVELNELLDSRPPRPQTITVTKMAAEQLLVIATAEGRANEILEITADQRGGFCMEFRSKLPADAQSFGHPDVALTIVATTMALARIGGATIDFRAERFTLDMPEDKKACACGKGECGCGGKCACAH